MTQTRHVSEALVVEPALMDRVRQVEPVIGEHRAWQEENRRMAPEVFDALSAAGLWAIYKPVELGGLECDPGIALSVFEEISRIEPSVGWAVANQAGIDTFGTVLPEEGAKDAYADPRRPVAGAWFPPGQATPV
jgi:3-hydroxy-9,10-secoandrosta-1,3,5(10)-triene-9,17-dione monooxygenase